MMGAAQGLIGQRLVLAVAQEMGSRFGDPLFVRWMEPDRKIEVRYPTGVVIENRMQLRPLVEKVFRNEACALVFQSKEDSIEAILAVFYNEENIGGFLVITNISRYEGSIIIEVTLDDLPWKEVYGWPPRTK